jgi:hypothetical protein
MLMKVPLWWEVDLPLRALTLLLPLMLPLAHQLWLVLWFWIVCKMKWIRALFIVIHVGFRLSIVAWLNSIVLRCLTQGHRAMMRSIVGRWLQIFFQNCVDLLDFYVLATWDDAPHRGTMAYTYFFIFFTLFAWFGGESS